MKERDLQDLQAGLDLLRGERCDEARTLLVAVRERSPELPDAHLLAAVAARKLGRTLLALTEIERAIELAPELSDLHANRGAVLCDLGRYDEAEAALLEALRRTPGDPVALGDLGRVLLHLKRPEEALQCLVPCALASPLDAGLHSDIGVAHVMMREVDKALGSYREALRLAPEDAEIHANHSRALLLAGRYEEGWREGEWRFRTHQYDRRPPLPAPVWDGGELTGKSLLLVAEQGFGDTIQMLRFAPLLAERGARVVVHCAEELVGLALDMPSVAEAYAQDALVPPVDLCVPMLSLPGLLGVTPETIPSEPFLQPSPRELEVELPEAARIGIAWAGKTHQTLSFDALSPLLAMEGAPFVSLQLGPQGFLARQEGLLDVSSQLHDFAATAAILEQLDLVVAVDTAVTHLALAMGKPTFVLLHQDSDWRWGLEGERTPWYPEARLFRQGVGQDWEELIPEVVEAVREHLRGPA